jgi:ribosomal protein S18 acetylase RimI-like enzyme
MTTAAVRVRDARPEDREAVRALTLAAYAEYAAVMEAEAFRSLDAAVRAALDFDEPADRVVAEHAGALVGSVMLFAPASDAYGGLTGRPRWPQLRLLAVAPAARGLGAGEALVAECVRRARAAGAPAIGLHTSRSMRAAVRLYTRLGFVRDPAFDFRPPGAELVEAYRLHLAG